MRNLDLLAALCPLLPPGPHLSIAPPNSPLDSLLDLHGVSADDRPGQLPVSFLSNPSFAFGQFDLDVLLDLHGRPLFIGAYDGEVVAPRDRLMRCETLDRCYGNLRSCSTLELRVVGELAPLLRGGAGLIARCRPVIVVGNVLATTDIHAVAAFLRELDYAFVDTTLSEVTTPCEGDFVLALPLSPNCALTTWRSAILGAPSDLRLAPLKVQVAALRRSYLEDPLEGWETHVPAGKMITDARLRGNASDGAVVRWTGPRQDARLLFYVPAPGLYRLAIEVADMASDDEPEPGKIVGRPVVGGSGVEAQPRCLVVDTAVSVGEMRTGCTVSMVAPKIGFRNVAGRWSLVGIAIAGFSLRRL